MVNEHVGEIFLAQVTRVEPYGVYLRFPHGEVIVLIPDVSYDRVPDLTVRYSVGDDVQVKILDYVEDRKLYKGTIKDAVSKDSTLK